MPRKLLIQSTGELLDTWGRRNRKLPYFRCHECGKICKPYRITSKYCSRPCLWKNNKSGNRKDGPIWWKNKKGYIEGKIWVNQQRVGVKQHRWVMENKIGRPLMPFEDVHHINGVKNDNRPENLEIIPHGHHSRKSNLNRVYKKGYQLNITEGERLSRSYRAISLQLAMKGRAAIAKAEGRI